MTQIPQINSILFTGASGRLGRLLRNSAYYKPSTDINFLFHGRKPGLDVMWQCGQPTDDLPPSDMIVALWGATGGSQASLAVNTALVETGIELAQAVGAKRIVHMSSAAVYGPGTNMNEDAPLNASNDYGVSKQEMERKVATFRHDPDLEHICLRLGNVVGADSLAPALRGDTPARLHQFPDGHGPRRSYIGAGDLLELFTALARMPNGICPPLLNVAAPSPIGMEDLLQAAGVSWEWQPAPDHAPQEVSLDVSKMRTIFSDLYCVNDAQALVNEWQMLESQR